MGGGIERLLIWGGLAMAALGGLLLLSRRLPWLRLGRLPGDIAIEGKGFGFYFPITTMLLISALVSIVLWLLRTIRR